MRTLIATGLVLGLVGLSAGKDTKDQAGDPTGTWKWTTEFNGQTRESTLKLKLDGDKLTGAMVGRNNNETPIENVGYPMRIVSAMCSLK